MLESKIMKQCGHFAIHIDFTCEAGQILVLTGPSGAGKTTIIRMLAGLESPDKGRITFDNTVWFDSDKKRMIPVRKRKVGYVFQEHTLFPHLTIEKNVGFSCPDQKRVRELLAVMGIEHLASRKIYQVSGGERQRAALAQALASEPKVLLLDEPFSALDSATRSRLCRELKKMKSRLAIPIVLVTHNAEEARYLGDKHIVLPSPVVPVAEPQVFGDECYGTCLAMQPGPCASHQL